MFDSTTRNRLAAFVSDARRLLCGEYNKPGGEITSLLQTYGIQPDGTVADLDSLPGLDQRGYELASTLRDVLAHKRANTVGLKAWGKYDPHVYDLIQEQAFTVLNRLCALRMAEERGILPYPVISKGLGSDGFELYEMVADKKHLKRDERYETFLFSVFDELSLDLGVLFDRYSPHGMLFPRSDALGELLEKLNHPDLAPLWAEDETIGWIYQYWNSKEERKAMRDASAAPRNSRELAVRNQFFTPRYVVEFLTDNTLGRIWYEMTQGQTRLQEQCRYLVRRPNEVFLAPGENAPEVASVQCSGGSEESLTQEELLNQPVHIPFRPMKDPREIRLLDPACGSMHFGLYAFDLFEAIYEEAWDLAQSGNLPAGADSSFTDYCSLITDHYDSKESYLRDVPRLIIEHNIHGVDIDPRAVQIAGLSLWLRAQKTWKDTPAAGRPRVRRSNIVCAEPMPGSDAMLEDFLQTLDPPLLGELVKTVFDKMQLAGEAGTLLKIEEEIRTAIDDAKAKWEKLGAAERDLFSAEELNQTLRPGAQQELTGVEKALTTDHRPLATDFFDTAEERIYAALRDYAESAEAGDYQRRLFAEDAAHGFAFIDLCRKRYDTVVMNPPFGDASSQALEILGRNYKEVGNDIGTAFVADAVRRWCPNGRAGVLLSTAPWFKPAFEKWRNQVFYGDFASFHVGAHFGGEVLDGATVNASCFVVDTTKGASTANVARLTRSTDLGGDLLDVVSELNQGHQTPSLFSIPVAEACFLPNNPFCYWASETLRHRLAALPPFEGSGGYVRTGLQTSDEPRFCRAWWELESTNPAWKAYSKSSPYSPFWDDYTWSEHIGDDLKEVAAFERSKVQGIDFFWKSGVTYPSKSVLGFNVRLHPAGCGFAHSGCVAFSDEVSAITLLGFLGSRPVEYLISLFIGDLQGKAGVHPNQYEVGTIQRLPWPGLTDGQQEVLAASALSCVDFLRSEETKSEVTRAFIHPGVSQDGSLLNALDFAIDCESKSISQVRNQREAAEEVVLNAYGFTSTDIDALDEAFAGRIPPASGKWRIYFEEEGSDIEQSDFASMLVSFWFGNTLGRWDIRYATGERQPPELPDPFDPLPVCPPGMLQNADGLPAAPADVPDDYPLPITWPGILVSDPGHLSHEGSSEDIVARVGDALAVIWGDRSAAIEQEACEILGVRTLRDYFAEKKSGGKFFKDHLKRYSKSRRQAPIYWPLSTESGTYTLWIYYHRLTEDTLFACITNFVAPKQEQSEKTLARLAAKGDARTQAEDKEYEQTEALIGELATFRAELERLAKIWKPNLNDGVQITAAPLWNLFRLRPWQTKLKSTWNSLEKGDYDWAHLAHTLWPERVIPKCATDRSLAIAHGYEEDLWEEVENDRGKLVWQPKKDAEEFVENLVTSRT